VATLKLSLVLAIGLLAMAALRTGPAGIARVDQHDRHSHELSLVLQERTQLVERPAGMPVSLGLLDRDPIPDALEVLKGDRGAGCLSFGDDLLADAVVLVATKIGLSLADLGKSASGALGADAVESGPSPGVVPSHALHLLPGERLAAGVGGQIDDPQVHAEHVGRLDRSVLGNVDRAEQVELALSINEIGLPLDAALPVLLVSTADEWDQQSTGERPHAYRGQALEAQDALVVADGRSRLEDRTLRLVPLEAFDRLGDRPHRELTGESELLADLMIGQLVDRDLTIDPGLESDLGCERRGLVEPLHRGQKIGLLIRCGQQSQLERELHASSVAISVPIVKGGAAPPHA